MDNIDLIMYNIMFGLYQHHAPVVFKGAMVLKAIQYMTCNKSGIERETHDIDGDWCGAKNTTDWYRQLLQQIVDELGYPLTVTIKREYSDTKSAGFKFINKNTNSEVFSMDLSIRPNKYGYLYRIENGLSFIGQDVDKVVADKLVVLSRHTILRRVKDMVDMYILSYAWIGFNKDILDIAKESRDGIGTYETFHNRVRDIKHAYSKYKNKASELDFGIMYNRVKLFISGFENASEVLYYDGNSWSRRQSCITESHFSARGDGVQR